MTLLKGRVRKAVQKEFSDSAAVIDLLVQARRSVCALDVYTLADSLKPVPRLGVLYQDDVKVAEEFTQARHAVLFSDYAYTSEWFFRVSRGRLFIDLLSFSDLLPAKLISIYAADLVLAVTELLTSKWTDVYAADSALVTDSLSAKQIGVYVVDSVLIVDSLSAYKSISVILDYVLYPLYRLFKQAPVSDGVSAVDTLSAKQIGAVLLDDVSVADALSTYKSFNAVLDHVLYALYRLFRQALLSDSANTADLLTAKQIGVYAEDSALPADLLMVKQIGAVLRDLLSTADRFPAYTHTAALYAVVSAANAIATEVIRLIDSLLYTLMNVKGDSTTAADSLVAVNLSKHAYDSVTVTDLFTASKQ